jgi:carboxypeptidase Taq
MRYLALFASLQRSSSLAFPGQVGYSFFTEHARVQFTHCYNLTKEICMVAREEHNSRAISFTTSDERISNLLQHLYEIDDISKLADLAGWDQQTAMPDGAGEVRGYQLATLQGLLHERMTAPRLGELLKELDGVVRQDRFTDADRGLVRQARRNYDLATKLPRALVEEMARVSVASIDAWTKARQQNDFASFAPWLQRTLDLQREVADRKGFTETRYDALLDEYDPGMTARQLETLFAPIRDTSMTLLQRIKASGNSLDADCLYGTFPPERQYQLCEKAAHSIGFDFTRGLIARSAHPFTTSFGSPFDVRFTVRYHEHLLAQSLMAALHEGGHALYEQGISQTLLRTPLAGGASSGLHESQSRLWENVLGRSEAFWQGKYALVQEVFPEHFKSVDRATFVRALNKVESSLIRVEADEVTYNLHIIIRFELEQALINGEITVESLPRLWNDKYRTYLGIGPENDTVGVLQDIHWATGFGYFPGYTLGNLYSAQIFHALRNALPNLDERLASGDTAPVLQWLREHMYVFGKIYLPEDLLIRMTGEPANPHYLVHYLHEKFQHLYGLPESA